MPIAASDPRSKYARSVRQIAEGIAGVGQTAKANGRTSLARLSLRWRRA
jgi:hypothetical protein